jgi:hypothetical protein
VNLLQIILDSSASKLLLNIAHGLFTFLAFLDSLKKSMPLTLSLLVDLRGKRFVLGMFCCIRNSTFELLSLFEQGTNRRVVVYRGRLF